VLGPGRVLEASIFPIRSVGSFDESQQRERSLLFDFRVCENCRHSNPRQREMMRDFHANPNITTTYEEIKKFAAEGNYTITVPNERHIQLEVGTFDKLLPLIFSGG
jgi:hypothetical protein